MIKPVNKQHGYFLVVAVLLIMVIGFLGTITAILLANRANTTVLSELGKEAFYLAESGLEIGAHVLLTPVMSGATGRIACGNLANNSSVTNASLSNGAVTITALSGAPYANVSTLSSALTASSTTIPVASATGFAASGTVRIDREVITYMGISGNSLIAVTRGQNNTAAASHASGTVVSQLQCTIDVKAGIPNLTAPTYQRELQTAVQLQEGWTVGDLSGSNFPFLHWNQPTELAWNALNVAGGSNVATLNGIDMASNGEGWAVGAQVGSNFTILHWLGNSWTLSSATAPCTGQNLNDISIVSSKEAWAVGLAYGDGCSGSANKDITVVYWNGSSWTALTNNTTPSVPTKSKSLTNLHAVDVIDTVGNGTGTLGFAVGDSGEILQYGSSAWSLISSPTSNALYDVQVVSGSEAWAVGAGGTILRWNGSSWSTFTSPTSTQLNGLALIDTNNDGLANYGIAVGNNGVIISYNGTTWSTQSSGTTNNFNDVALFTTQDAWAVGASGSLWHWNGSSWASVSSGTTRNLYAIAAISPGLIPTAAWSQVYP